MLLRNPKVVQRSTIDRRDSRSCLSIASGSSMSSVRRACSAMMLRLDSNPSMAFRWRACSERLVAINSPMVSSVFSRRVNSCCTCLASSVSRTSRVLNEVSSNFPMSFSIVSSRICWRFATTSSARNDSSSGSRLSARRLSSPFIWATRPFCADIGNTCCKGISSISAVDVA